MDGDPAVEPELDAFSLILPLPYRIAVIIILGNSRLTYPFKLPVLNSRARNMGVGRQSAMPFYPQDRTQ